MWILEPDNFISLAPDIVSLCMGSKNNVIAEMFIDVCKTSQSVPRDSNIRRHSDVTYVVIDAPEIIQRLF